MFGRNTSKQWSSELTKAQFQKDRGIIYKTNGSGRDTYIFNDNGGFSVMNGPTNYEKPGNFLPTVKRYQQKNPVIQSKSVNYRQDGSGRDSYIMIGNGGYSNSGKLQEFREAFKTSLRTYERNGDYFSNRNLSCKKKNYQNILTYIQASQQDLTPDRLKNANEKEKNFEATLQPNISNKSMFKDNSNIQQAVVPMNKDYFSNQSLYGKNFQSSRNSFGNMLTDNPTLKQQRLLKGYQQTLDSRLSQPKLREGSPTNEQHSPQADYSFNDSQFKNNGKKRILKVKKISVEERQQLYKSFLDKSQNNADTEKTIKKNYKAISALSYQQNDNDYSSPPRRIALDNLQY